MGLALLRSELLLSLEILVDFVCCWRHDIYLIDDDDK